MIKALLGLLIILLSLSIIGCSKPNNITKFNKDEDSKAFNKNNQLEKCTKPLGTLIVNDGRNTDWFKYFNSSTKVTTFESLIRLAVQQSNCFIIRSVGNNRTDRRISRITNMLNNSGECRAGYEYRHRRVFADYYLETKVIIDSSDGLLLNGILGEFGVMGQIIGGIREINPSEVTLTLSDLRLVRKITISEGGSTSNNYDTAIDRLLGDRIPRNLGGFETTASGRATIAAFLVAYNDMVRSLKNYKVQEENGDENDCDTGGIDPDKTGGASNRCQKKSH